MLPLALLKTAQGHPVVRVGMDNAVVIGLQCFLAHSTLP